MSAFGQAKVHTVRSVADRLKYINDQVFATQRDPEMRALALWLVQNCPQHGVESESCEISAVFNFVKQNVKYRQDPQNYDLYATGRRTLQVRAGDCFTLDTPIIVRDKQRGEYDIRTLSELETLWPAYDALTYDFSKTEWTFKPITAWQNRGEKEVYQSHLSNGPTFKHTADHSVWWYDGQNSSKRVVERELGSALEEERGYFRRVLVATKLPALGKEIGNESHAYLSGIYTAEGFADDYHVRIAQDKSDVRTKIEQALLEQDVPFSPSSRSKHAYYTVLKGDAKEWLRGHGSNSFDMAFTSASLSSTEHYIRAMLEAHGDGDAYRPKADSAWARKVHAIHATSSPKLAQQLQLISMILGDPWHTQLQLGHGGVGSNPMWRFHRWLDSTRPAKRNIEELPGAGYSPIKATTYAGRAQVADITVADTHNFVLANGMIAHNCDDHCILICGLLGCIGYYTGAKVVSPDGTNWHIYATAGYNPRHNPSVVIPLDTTQPPAFPGWEPPAVHRRYTKNVTFTEGGPVIEDVR